MLQGAVWRKSSHSSGGNQGDCVEVAVSEVIVGVRDSKAQAAGALVFPRTAWRKFLDA
jgi:hypothetical protein